MGYVVIITNRWRQHFPAKRWYPCTKLYGVTYLRLSERLWNIICLTMFTWACLSSLSVTYCRLGAFTAQHNIIISSSFIHQWHYSTLLGPGIFFIFVIFFSQTVGLLGRVISPSQGRYLQTGQLKQNKRIYTTNFHALSEIRTHNPSVRADEDGSCLRPHGHCDRL
jgi:hypothetical protein